MGIVAACDFGAGAAGGTVLRAAFSCFGLGPPNWPAASRCSCLLSFLGRFISMAGRGDRATRLHRPLFEVDSEGPSEGAMNAPARRHAASRSTEWTRMWSDDDDPRRVSDLAAS